MKQRSTDQLLTLGMALTTDRRTMERRVRGVFARKRSAKGVLALSALLVLALGFAAFTTACQPGQDARELTPIPVEQTGVNEANLSSSAQTSGSHITQPTETLSGGVKIVVDADVKIQKTQGYSIRECSLTAFTADEYSKMLDYFAPDASWTRHADAVDTNVSVPFQISDKDMDGLTILSTERDGKTIYAELGDRSKKFLAIGTGGVLYSEGLLLGDEEMDQEFGDIIREPIALTQSSAQSQADQVLHDLDIQGLQINSAQRAGIFDEQNTDNVLSRGWLITYGLTNEGLTVRNGFSYSHNKNDRLSYWSVYSGGIAVYVDESGVALFDCEKRYQPSEKTYPVESIISVDEALKLGKERLARLYGDDASSETQIEIYAVRLGSTLIGFSDKLTGQPFPEVYESIALLIPTWDILYREVYTGGDVQYFTMPFCAIDGGAVSMMGS